MPAEMRRTMNQIEEIKKLKEEKDAVILAHYYVEGKFRQSPIMSAIPMP